MKSGLKKLRENSGLSVVALSNLIGVSPSTVRRYEVDGALVPDAIMEKAERVCSGIRADEVNKAADRLRFYRESLGMNRTDFAEEAGIPRSNYYEIENGNQELTEKVAKKIEERFDVGREWLMYGLEKEKEFPVSDKLISWIKEDLQLRQELWERMNG